MKAHRGAQVALVCSVPAMCSGCWVARTLQESRSWELEYIEKLTVLTEPAGAKIYIEGAVANFAGISPVQTRLTGTRVTATQYGTYPGEKFTDSPKTRRTGPTTWMPGLNCSASQGAWTVKAFLDGYQPAETKIVAGNTDAFRLATSALRVSPDDRLPSVVEGENSILLSLVPLAPAIGPTGSQQQQQQQQQTVVVPGVPGQGQSVGSLTITSAIEHSEILVDGVFVGNAPATLKLSDGIHIIEVRGGGGKSYRREVRVFSGAELTLRAVFD